MSENRKPEYTKISMVKVVKARKISGTNGAFINFDLMLNGVLIYGCKIVSGDKGEFIGFPSRKGKDDKYYSIAYVHLSPIATKQIIDKVREMLPADDSEFMDVPETDGDSLPFV